MASTIVSGTASRAGTAATACARAVRRPLDKNIIPGSCLLFRPNFPSQPRSVTTSVHAWHKISVFCAISFAQWIIRFYLPCWSYHTTDILTDSSRDWKRSLFDPLGTHVSSRPVRQTPTESVVGASSTCISWELLTIFKNGQ